MIGSFLASYSRTLGWSGVAVNPSPGNPFMHDQVNELLLDIATGEKDAIASPQMFSHDYVVRLIEGLEMYPSWSSEPHDQAKALRSFYLEGARSELSMIKLHATR